MAKKKQQDKKNKQDFGVPKPLDPSKAFLFINRSSQPTKVRQDKGYGMEDLVEDLVECLVSYVFVVYKGKGEKQFNL